MRFELEVDTIDLGLTLGCGQTFRWKMQSDGAWEGVLKQHYVTLRQDGSRIRGEAMPGGGDIEALVLELLRAQDDVGKIQRRLRRDPVIAIGLAWLKGLRIVKLDEWECLISYVLATFANIPRIMKMIDEIATRFGPRITRNIHSFPSRKQLAKATVGELSRCGLGYRAKFVKEMCKVVDEDVLDAFRHDDYEDLRRNLIELPGVGEKVADCVSLFGFGMLESFPIDVWIERALARLYHEKGTYRRLRAFASERFGEYAGYAQEYLYHNEREHARESVCVFSKQRDQ